MHPRFAERTNPDVLALHEAFADIVALFQHFSFPAVIEHQLAATRGDLSAKSLLVDLARQVGIAIGLRGSLRSAIDEPADPALLARTQQVHQRGAILVAAVFDAFLAIYELRTRDLVRLATQGSGVLGDGQLSPDLVKRLAQEAADIAQRILHMCIRAMDYVPPVDVTFGDFLRAIVTADMDTGTADSSFLTALLESFRQRGIFPAGLNTVSVESLLWPRPQEPQRPASLPGLVFTLETANKDEQESVEKEFAHYNQLVTAQNELRDLLAMSEVADVGRLMLSAETPFDAVNQRLQEGTQLASVLQDSKKTADDAGANESPRAHFSLEWGVEGDRKTKEFLSRQNRQQFYYTWIMQWARENPEWAFKTLGLVLFAAKHRADGKGDYTTSELPHGISYSSGKDVRALPSSVPAVEVHAFRVSRRRGPRGSYLNELIVEITQGRRGYFDADDQDAIDSGTQEFDEDGRGEFTLRGGCTLIIDPRNAGDTPYGIRRVIKKGTILDVDRLEAHRRFLSKDDGSLRASYFGMPDEHGHEECFAVLHSGSDE